MVGARTARSSGCASRTAAEPFWFIDGPITANNPMGVHHAWGRSLKDLFQRYQAMRGPTSATRTASTARASGSRSRSRRRSASTRSPRSRNTASTEFAARCRDRVAEYSGVITEQSKRLGMWMDWDAYYTMTDTNIEYIWRFLKHCHERGWLYKGHRPMWCPRCGTSLSQHELPATRYQELEHPSLYVRFRSRTRQGEALVVWTTTPWTLPANVAAAVKPDAEYVLSDAAASGARSSASPGREVVRQRRAARSWSASVRGPFDELARAGRRRPPRDPVGRGRAGRGHRHRPHRAGLRRGGLRALARAGPAGARRRSTRPGSSSPATATFAGHSDDEAPDRSSPRCASAASSSRPARATATRPAGAAGRSSSSASSTSGSSRCDEIRQPMIEANADGRLDAVALGKRMEDWLRNMGDWCISRKRYWGLPLPFYPCPCGHAERRRLAGGAAGARHRRARAAAGAAPALDRRGPDRLRGMRGEVRRVPEVGDAWLDAGIVPFSTLGWANPSAIEPGYATGAAQGLTTADLPDHAYWETVVPGRLDLGDARADPALVLLAAVHVGGARDRLPYRAVLTYEKLLDEHGREMHQSWGNAIGSTRRSSRSARDVSRWMFAGRTPAEHPLRLRAGQRRQAAAAHALEHGRLPRHLREHRRLAADRGEGPSRRRPQRSTAG